MEDQPAWMADMTEFVDISLNDSGIVLFLVITYCMYWVLIAEFTKVDLTSVCSDCCSTLLARHRCKLCVVLVELNILLLIFQKVRGEQPPYVGKSSKPGFRLFRNHLASPLP